MESALRWLGYGLCHQLPERSFFGGGMQVPVCARDTGIYAGFAVGLIVLALAHRSRRPSELPPWPVMTLLGGFIGMMAIDGLTSYTGLRTTTNDIRLITGLLAGFALAALTAPLLNSQLWSQFSSGKVLGDLRSAGVFFGAIPFAFAAIRYAAPLLGWLYPLLVAVFIIATFCAVNLVIVCLLPWFERKAASWSQLGAPLAIALALSFGEFAGATALRTWLEHLAQLST